MRFVQVWSGADNGFPRRNWDSHEDIAKDHGEMGASMDRPAGRAAQGSQSARACSTTRSSSGPPNSAACRAARAKAATTIRSRSHPGWPAADSSGGTTYGASDEWSYKAVEKPTYCYDLHATVLHLLGIDHTS